MCIRDSTNSEATVTLKATRGDLSITKQLAMKAGRKKTDISWRGSLWSIKPVLATWCTPMKEKRVKSLRLAKGVKPIEVRWINTDRPEGRNAKRAGLRKGDIIICMEGEPLRMSSQHFNMHVKLNYKVGDKLPLTLLRDGKRIKFDWPLTDLD